jgi:hypothetical protein
MTRGKVRAITGRINNILKGLPGEASEKAGRLCLATAPGADGTHCCWHTALNDKMTDFKICKQRKQQRLTASYRSFLNILLKGLSKHGGRRRGGGRSCCPPAALPPSLPWATTPDLDSVDARSPESVMGRFITMQVCSDGYAAGGLAFDNVQQQSLGC